MQQANHHFDASKTRSSKIEGDLSYDASNLGLDVRAAALASPMEREATLPMQGRLASSCYQNQRSTTHIKNSTERFHSACSQCMTPLGRSLVFFYYQ